MSSGNASYWQPTALVRQYHLILHLDENLQPVSNDFGITDGSFWNDYTRSLLPVPGMFLFLGFLSLFLLLAGLACRCCLRDACRCINVRSAESSSSFLNAVNLTRIFTVLTLLTVLSNQALFIGNNFLSSGVNSAVDALNVLDTDVSQLEIYGVNLEDSGNTMLMDFQTSTCPAIGPSGVIGYVETFLAEVETYNSYISPLPGPISNAKDIMDNWGKTFKDASIWVLYAAVMGVAGLFRVGLSCKSVLFLQCSISLSLMVMLVFCVLCFVQMVLLMLTSDFCVDATDNLLQTLSPDSATYDMVSFYSTCQGVNPILSPLEEAFSYSQDLDAAIQGLLSACPGDQYILNAQQEADNINNYLTGIYNIAQCPPLNEEINNVLHSGICYNTFVGFFTIWLSQFMTTIFLFALTVLISFMYLYFIKQDDALDTLIVAGQPGSGNSEQVNVTYSGEYIHGSGANNYTLNYPQQK